MKKMRKELRNYNKLQIRINFCLRTTTLRKAQPFERNDKGNIIIIIIIFINCNWVITRWQWLFYMYTNMKKKSD